MAHVFKGGLHGLALRIEHGFFWRNDNFGFHHKSKRNFPAVEKNNVRYRLPLVKQEIRRDPEAAAIKAKITYDSGIIINFLCA
jgi:hypothetical protein